MNALPKKMLTSLVNMHADDTIVDGFTSNDDLSADLDHKAGCKAKSRKIVPQTRSARKET